MDESLPLAKIAEEGSTFDNLEYWHIDLEIEDIKAWNVEKDHFYQIQRSLISKGAKLLAGPRGTGKTHQMRYIYQQCIEEKGDPLPVYVTFGRYYHLEPFLVKESNAIQIIGANVGCD